MERKDKQEQELMVTVQCLVYNHEKYLRECLDGFVGQRTDFRFEVLVHEDVSTDGSAAIVREYAERYPEIIRPIFETENQYSKQDGSLDRIVDAATHGRYIAFCEGDDYWTDPLKLQKEVDFLEAHPECGMVHTSARVWEEDSGRFRKELFGRDGVTFQSLLVWSPVTTLTVMCRRSLYTEARSSFEPEVVRTWMMGDYPLWLWIAAHSSVGFLPEPTGVYRFRVESASHSTDHARVMRFAFNAYEISRYFADRYLKGRKAWWNYVNVRFSHLYHQVKHDHFVMLGTLLRYFRQDFGRMSFKNRLRVLKSEFKVRTKPERYDRH